jgi:hypothetical protein
MKEQVELLSVLPLQAEFTRKFIGIVGGAVECTSVNLKGRHALLSVVGPDYKIGGSGRLLDTNLFKGNFALGQEPFGAVTVAAPLRGVHTNFLARRLHLLIFTSLTGRTGVPDFVRQPKHR